MAVEHLRWLLEGLADGPACLVRVESTQGSVPREPGAWMAVFADRIVATIGGGHLEHQAIAEARRRLAGIPPSSSAPVRFALGPALGQCCGGVVYLAFELLTATDVPTLAERLAPRLHPVALFGGGHVGHALARVLAPLPFALTWIDSRDGIFPQPAPDGVACEHSDPVQMAVPGLAPGTRVLIMSFSHAEDLDVVAACLRRQRERQDLPFIGLIGSKTKWATFSNRLHGRGFAPDEMAQVTCPIGVPGIEGKEPEVIAVAVAAQLLQTLAVPTSAQPRPG
ncbi:xanthine dehydrogenase accessory protein XdhC [Acidovorax sp. sic0104]|uniref:xanthine dehydrogenase accessory protein XdhC n=1 Tax=Acidovorax sp. sic0104 TaxID=2854784 RepID=UPI001C484720|nr:xanthine dehydrogenase accessory protein XdhC [Acidovorax sp. sic0104]MBV7539724.1 xanthine dehydrogenase accessory protein XdhC [Acidovorax sp. sic0104]